MSTSSTASTNVISLRQSVRPIQITVQRPSGPSDHDSARIRAQSAPGMCQQLKKPAPTLIPTDQQIEALLAELKLAYKSASTGMSEPVAVARSSSASNDAPQTESNYDRLIEELFHSQLSQATQSKNPASRTEALRAAITMLKQMEPGMRKAARSEIIVAIGNSPRGADCESLLASVIDDFIAAYSDKSNVKTNEAAQSFVEELSAAVAGFPLRTKCKLLVLELWAAKKMNAFSLAKAAVDKFADDLPEADPAKACKNITETAPYIGAMPTRYSLMFAMALCQCAPEASPWKLRSLEAIAAKDPLLPPNDEVISFRKTLNQQIYELRIAEAAQL